jgi:secernin
MCDTILAPPSSTRSGQMLFGKNSDRQRNESQSVEYLPPANYVPGSVVSCTYATIPQAQHTHAVLLCRPFWIWGAEMGANEHGVVIGNEGIHARSAAPQEEALTGMDLLRLALERASTAEEAVAVITTLLDRHGQGGNCGHVTPSYYNNGFILADATEGFVLETVGKEWLVERIGGIRTVSNSYSIGRQAQSVSGGLATLIRNSGWSADGEPDYARAIAHPQKEHIRGAVERRSRSASLLTAQNGRLTVADMFGALRDHGLDEGHYDEECTTKRTLCMHAGTDDRPGQTVGSMVSELRQSEAVHWVTGTAAPCISIFKPLLIGSVPPAGRRPSDRFDSGCLWWQHERLHRAAILGDFGQFLDQIRPERGALEANFQARIKAVLSGGSAPERSQAVAQCWREATDAENRWRTLLRAPTSIVDRPHVRTWKAMNAVAGIEPFSGAGIHQEP